MSDIAMYSGGMEPVQMDMDILDTVASMAGASDFIKLTEDGFEYNGRVLPTFTGRIVGNNPYLCKWEGNTPIKLPIVRGTPAPEGYEPKCDLRIAYGDQELTLSLSKTSFIYKYAPYVEFLKRQGLTPADVATKFAFTLRQNGFGKNYAQATFEMVGTLAALAGAGKPAAVTTINVTPTATPPPPPAAAPSESAPLAGW